MPNRIQRLARDERGISLIFVGVGLTAFLATTTLAIDLGMMMMARNQAQNAADAGALAGATALAFNDFNDRTASGPAVQSAVSAASANQVAGGPVSVGTGDVSFETGPSGQSDRVRTQVYRTSTRGTAIQTMFASMFGVSTVDITAAATAEAVLASADTCIKPWAIPDKWIEVQTPGWDTSDTFTAFPANPSVFPDIYRGVTQANYSGYTRGDVGRQIKILPESANLIEGDMYFPLALPGSSGVADFVSNISSCGTATMAIGDTLTVQPGVVGANTAAGAAALIALDPTAYWDTATNKVVSTHNPSPRVVVLPVYDPLYFDQGKQVGNFTQIRISNFVGFFVDHLIGNNVLGRITPVLGQVATNGTPAPVGSFPRAIRLVQ